MMNNWYLVVDAKGEQTVTRAYNVRDHAQAVATTNDYDYPLSGPWRVIELRETGAAYVEQAA